MQRTKQSQSNLSTDDMVISLGSNVKALGDGRIGGHLVLWGDPSQKDFYGDYFTPETYIGPADADGRDVTINHRQSIRTGNPEIDATMKSFTDPLFKLGGLKTHRDELGIFAEVVCDLSDQYDALVYKLAEQGKLKWSGGAPSHMIAREADGRLKMFVIAEGALTPIPAEPRMVTSRVMPLKAYVDFLNQTPEPLSRNGSNLKGAPMNILDAITKLVPGLTPEQADAIATLLGLVGIEVGKPAAEAEGETPEGEQAPEGDMPPIRSIPIEDLVGRLKSLGYQVNLPGQISTGSTSAAPVAAPKPAVTRPPLPFGDTSPAAEDDKATKSLEAIYTLRFGDEDSARKAILTDVIGSNYRARILEQNRAYAKYLRYGENALDGAERKSLRQQIFPLKEIERLTREGMDIGQVKATQMEAQGELGGFAVPPNFQSEIVARLPGLTAVRGAGATVITLANSNSVEIPIYDGGDDRYVGNLRGEWGNETKTPGEQNAKLKLETVTANIYTYKVPMSMSVVEDASNLVSLVQQDMSDTMTIDEDDAFLTADGVGKPLGILPGGLNGLSLKEVKSGSASTILASGVKGLKRGVPSQYRNDGVWVGNSDSYAIIEALTVGGGNLTYAFPDLSDTGELLGRKTFESEALPDVAGNAFPMIFGVMRGYVIVERLGMTIERFHDSYTGANKVEYHLRRRIGGRVNRPWLFAVMKISA